MSVWPVRVHSLKPVSPPTVRLPNSLKSVFLFEDQRRGGPDLRYWLIIGMAVLLSLLFFLLLAAGLDLAISRSAKLSLSTWGSILGFPVSLLGMLFSGLAVYEVRSLTKRYIGRERLPELARELSTETEAYITKAKAPLEDLIAGGVIARIVATLRAVRSHATTKELKDATSSASAMIAAFKDTAGNVAEKGIVSSSQVDGFWQAYDALEELRVEIKNYRRDERKRQNVQ